MLKVISFSHVEYIVVKDKKVVRSAIVCGAHEAYIVLKPKKGETLYIKVGDQK